MNNKDVMIRVTEIMRDLGVPASLIGYQYIRDGVLLIIKDPMLICSITTKFYPMIAKHFETTGARVERSIRHAIEVAWNRGNPDSYRKYFGYTLDKTKGKPTASEFIATIADQIKLEIEDDENSLDESTSNNIDISDRVEHCGYGMYY